MYGGDHPTKDDEKWQEQPRRSSCRAYPGSARTSGREPAAHACGRATTRTSSGRSSTCWPGTGSPSLVPSVSGPTSSRLPSVLDEQVAERFGDFLDAHVELGLGTIPTFIVGHMSGQNWDPPWRGGRDLYRDPWLLSQQAWFAGEIARRFGSHLAVVGWLISNEMPLYGGTGTSEEVAAWARALVQAVRSAGAQQPISLGDGAWGVEVTGADNGYSLRALAPLVDFVGPHSYPMQDDQVRQFLAPAFACELAGTFGKPVVLEEFGVSSDFAADEHAAAYYRQVLHTTLLAGARGWIAWNNCDYDDLRAEDPYRHHVFELHFGLTDRARRAKAAAARAARLRRARARSLGARLGTGRRRRGARRPGALRACLALHRAVVPERPPRQPLPGVRRSARGRPAGGADARVRRLARLARLYLAPCAKLLTAPGIDRLRELAEGGATVYASYFAGSTANQRGPWLSWLDEIFGIRHLPALRPRRPDRGGRGDAPVRRGLRRHPRRNETVVPRRRREQRPRLPAGRAALRSRSSRSTLTDGRRSSPTSSAAAGPSSAPTRSSTSPPGRRG